MSQVFISYSRVDDKFTDQLIDRIQQAFPDLKIWRDNGHHGLVGGDNWWDEILHAIDESDIFIYVLSNESIQSLYCQAEFTEARRLRKRIITIQARDRTELTDALGDIQFIDMKDGVDNPASLMRLNAAINKQLGLAKKSRPLWTPKTAKPGKDKQPIRDASAPDITTAPLVVPNAEQSALKIARAGLRWQIILGIAGLVVALFIGLLPIVSEQIKTTNETAVANAQMASTPNPIQKVQTLDAQATEQQAALVITQDNMTAQARLNAISSATAQVTVDAIASANARMNEYATLTALASFTPPTQTPTITPTKMPTATLTPLPTSVVGNNILVTFRDDFTESKPSRWQSWEENPNLKNENGELVIKGRGANDGIYRDLYINKNHGILILFRQSGLSGGVRLEKGTWNTNSWREWSWATWSGIYSKIGTEKEKTYSFPFIGAGSSYYLMFRIGDNGHFYTQIWAKNATQFSANIDQVPYGNSEDNAWKFLIQVDEGTFRADFYEELIFPENYVMPNTPPIIP